MLLYLSEGGSYDGGGTGFWAENARPLLVRAREVLRGGSATPEAGWRLLCDHRATSDPTIVIRPPRGSALVRRISPSNVRLEHAHAASEVAL